MGIAGQIEETHAKNQVPIVVGGTSYWIQHLIFPDRMASLDKSGDGASQATQCSPLSVSEAFAKALASLPPDLLALFNEIPDTAPSADTNPQLCLSLHRLLELLDPLVAQRWHWRDSRKVLTNLRVIQENRRLASEVIREQSRTVSKPRHACPILTKNNGDEHLTNTQVPHTVLLVVRKA